MMVDGEAAGGSGGPLGRLDFDSLSIVLSMLSTTDFLHAIRSSKRLYSARLKKTAWPPLPAQADAMLRAIVPGGPDNASSSSSSSFRGLRSTFDQRGQKLKHLLTLLPSVATADNGAPACSASAMWRNVRQVSLDCKVEYHKQRDGAKFLQPLEQLLSGLARHLPQMSSLSLANLNPYFTPGFVQSFYTDLAARGQLEALSLNKCAWTFARADMLAILAPCLRVLSLDCSPAPAVLIPLVHLESLHIAGSYGGRIDPDALATTIRFLSTKHALRTLSLVRSDVDRILYLLTLTAAIPGGAVEPSTEVVQAHFASDLSSLNSSTGSRELRNPPQLDNASLGVGVELVDVAVPSRLTSLSVALPLPNAWQVESLCAGLPELTHLELTGCGAGPGRGFVCAGPNKAALDVFARMHSLTLSFSDEYTFTKEHLRACNQLRSLRLTQHQKTAVPLDIVIEILERNAATLEEMRLDGETTIEMPSQDQNAAASATQRLQTALASCTRLRVLELAASAGVGAVVAALPRAPALQTLELACHQVAKQGGLDALRAVDLLRLMSSSSSWCSTHVHLAPREMMATLGSAAALEEVWPAASIAAASSSEATTLRRIRLFVHRTATTDCFCLRPRADDNVDDAAASPQWQLDFTEHNA
jgi:hypothetical protein